MASVKRSLKAKAAKQAANAGNESNDPAGGISFTSTVLASVGGIRMSELLRHNQAQLKEDQEARNAAQRKTSATVPRVTQASTAVEEGLRSPNISSSFRSKYLKRKRDSSIPDSYETGSDEAGSVRVNHAKTDSRETDCDETGTVPSVMDSIEDGTDEEQDVRATAKTHDKMDASSDTSSDSSNDANPQERVRRSLTPSPPAIDESSSSSSSSEKPFELNKD